MTPIDRLIERVRRRLTLTLWVRELERGVRWGAVAGILLLLASRLAGLELPWWAIAVPPALGAAWGTWRAWRTRPSRHDAAVWIDRSVGLKDRIATAAYLESQQESEGPFADLALADARSWAERVDPRQAAPWSMPRLWPASAAALVALGISAWLVPAYDWSSQERERQAARARRQAEVQEALREAASRVEPVALESAGDQPADDAALEESLQARATLQRLAEQLSGAPDESDGESASLHPDEALTEAADELDDLADDLEREATAQREAIDETLQRWSGLEPPVASESDPLTDALRRGDLAAAAQAARELARMAEDWSEEDRRAMSQYLRDVADRVADQAPPTATDPRDERAQRLADQGVPSDEARRLAEQDVDQEALRDALRQAGADPETADRLAEQLKEDAARQEAREQVDQRVRDAADRLRDLADTLEREPESAPPPDDPGAPKTGPPPSERPDPSDSAPPSPPREPSDSTQPQDQQRPQDQREADPSQDQQSTDPDSSRDGKQPSRGEQDSSNEGGSQRREQEPQQGTQEGERPEPTESSSQPQQDESGGDEPQTQETPQEGSQPSQDQPREGDSSQGERSQNQPSPTGPSQQQGGSQQPGQPTQPQPGQPSQGSPDQAGGEGAGQSVEPGASDQAPPRTPEEAAERFERAMEELHRLERDAQRKREASERMREQARELVDRLSPEQREQMQQWAHQQAREQGRPEALGTSPGPGARDAALRYRQRPDASELETDDVDLRDPDTGDRRIAEWYSNRPHTGGSAVDRSAAAAQAQRAAEAVERALSEQAIPLRHRELIRRWAERLPEAVREAPDPSDRS